MNEEEAKALANDIVKSLNDASLGANGISKKWLRKEVPTASGVQIGVILQALALPFRGLPIVGDMAKEGANIVENAIDQHNRDTREKNARRYQEILTERAKEWIGRADDPTRIASTFKKVLLGIVPNCKETQDAISRVCEYLNVHLDEAARRALVEQTAQFEEWKFDIQKRLNEQTLANLTNQADLMDMMRQFTTEQTDQMLGALEQFELNLDDGQLRIDMKEVLDVLNEARDAQRESLATQRDAEAFQQKLEGAVAVCDAVSTIGTVVDHPGLRQAGAIGRQAVNIASAIRAFRQTQGGGTLAWLSAGSRLMAASVCVLQLVGCFGGSSDSDFTSSMLEAISEQVENLRIEMHERFDKLEMLMELRFDELQHEFRIHVFFMRHALETMHVDLRDRVNAQTQRALDIAHAQKMDDLRRFFNRANLDEPIADRIAFLRDVAEGIALSHSTGERHLNNIQFLNLFNGAGIARDHSQLHIDAEILHFAGTERTGLFVDVVRALGVPFKLPDFIIAPEAWSAVALVTCRLIRNVQCSPKGPRFMADVGPRLDALVRDGDEFLSFCNEDLTRVAEQVCTSLEDDLDRLRQEVDSATARLNNRLSEGEPMYTEGLGTQMRDLLDAGSRLVEARKVLENATWTNDPITSMSRRAKGCFQWPSPEQYLNAMTDWEWMHPVIRALAASKEVAMLLKVTTGVGELIEVHPWEPHRARYVVHTAQNMGLRVIATVRGIGDFEIWSPTVGAEPGYPRSHWWAGGRSSIPYMLDMTLSPGFKKLGAPCPLDEAAIDSLKTALITPLRRARCGAKEELLRLVGPESQVSRRIKATLTVLEYIAKLKGASVGNRLYASVNAADRYAEALGTVDPDTLGAFPQASEFCERARASLATLKNLIGASREGIAMRSVATTIREVRQVQTLCNKIPNAASDPIGDVHEPCAATRDMFRDCTAKQICRDEWSRANENGKLQLLGRSERSTVHAGILETDTGLVPVAIKSTCIQDPDDLESLANEVRALLRVGDHPRLLGFYGYTLTRDLGGEERVVLILELGTTSLAASLEQAQDSLTADAALYISWSVVEGVRRCHALGVVHQDIKAENVVMVDGRAKLADMGNASIRRMAATTRTMRRPVQAGFSASAAPEVLMKPDGYEQGHTRQSDAYSLGLLLLQIQLARHGVPLFGSKKSGAPLPDCFMQVIGMYCAVQEDPFQLHPRIEAAMHQKGIDERVLPAIRTCLVERTLPALQLPNRALPEQKSTQEPASAFPRAPQSEPPMLLVAE